MGKTETKWRRPMISDFDSENLESFGYANPEESLFIEKEGILDSEPTNLYIRFKRTHTLYLYTDVPFEISNGLLTAESKGKYFRQNIEGKYNTFKYVDIRPVESVNNHFFTKEFGTIESYLVKVHLKNE